MLTKNSFRICLILLTVAAFCLPGGSGARAQDPEFESLLCQREVTCLLQVGDAVLGGLDLGGLLIWDSAAPGEVTRIPAGQQLGGNQVSDMVWTGRHVWVATLDGGMTRIASPGNDPSFRPYTSNLGSLEITAVTGKVIGSSERVFYAMNGAGLGAVIDGLPGAVYTAEQDGLIDNDINDLIFLQDELFIATPSGVSRFADNTFTDVNDGLGVTEVLSLGLDPEGRLVCGVSGDVYRWNAGTETWSSLDWGSGLVQDLHSNEQGLWGFSIVGGVTGRLGLHDGNGWTYPELPRQRATCMFAGDQLWVGGRYIAEGMNSSLTGQAWFAHLDGNENWTVQTQDASLVTNAVGAALEVDGTRWVGSRTGKSFSGISAQGNTHVYQLASVENDSTGLFNQFAPILCMAADDQGLVYTAQLSAGIVRHDKNTGELDLMYPGNSGLTGRLVLNMVTHPDRSLIMMHDSADELKVQVLMDPLHWRNPASWVDVPQGVGPGIGSGSRVLDALVERNDVIWFAVDGTGLVRWDINGYSNGPDDPLTWDDFSDDGWDGPLGEIDGTNNDPSLAWALDLAPDGSIWIGGNGVTRATYDSALGLEMVEAYVGKTAAFQDGLISGTVTDLAVDLNGDCWISTSAGVNRIVHGTAEPQIDAYFNLGHYLGTSLYTALYSPNTVTELPGGILNRLVASADRRTLALTTSMGAVAWTVTERGTAASDDMAGAYFYPHPFMPSEGDGLLKLGGISADAVNSDGARVEVYNLEGQLVYRNSQVSEEEGFWSGENRLGEPVASGMYLIRLTWRDQVTTRSLAVVR